MKRSVTGGNQFKSPLAKQFKSPLARARETTISTFELKKEITQLREKLQATKVEIKELESSGHRESELQTHIEKLHEYNEVKDIGQMLFGRLAVLDGVQTKDLYGKYGLNLSD